MSRFVEVFCALVDMFWWAVIASNLSAIAVMLIRHEPVDSILGPKATYVSMGGICISALLKIAMHVRP